MLTLLVESWFHLNKKTYNKEVTYYNVGKGDLGLAGGTVFFTSVTNFADERFKKKSNVALFDDKDSTSWMLRLRVTKSNIKTLISLSLRGFTISMMWRSMRVVATRLLRKILTDLDDGNFTTMKSLAP